MTGPDKKKLYPNENIKTVCYISNLPKRPNVEIGEYTYYSDNKKSAEEFYDNIEFAVEFGNKNLTSDAIVASILLHSAIESAIVNVFVNFNSLGNKEGYENIPAECKEIIESSLVKKTEIVKSFGI